MPLSGGGGGGEEFVRRADPSAWDFDEGDLTIDGDWHEVDFSSIITDADAVYGYFRIRVQDSVADAAFELRPAGNSYVFEGLETKAPVANAGNSAFGRVWCDSDRVFEYRVKAGMDQARICCLGWWKPA